MLPLTMAKRGETVTIRKITGKEVKDSRIALDQSMANRIMI